MTRSQQWWVYMIATDKQQLYTGISTDIDRRWQEHLDVALGKKNAKGAKFFRSQMPLTIVYRQEFSSRSAASCREAEIKKLTAAEKAKLV